MGRLTLLACSLTLLPCSLFAQEVDSSRVVVPPVADTSQQRDSTTIPDTLTAAQKLKSFEQRYMETKRARATIGQLSFFDSLVARFTPERLSVTEAVGQSFCHDAGDYFRSHPGFFTLDYQGVPMRKIVKPYGLAGNRLGVLNDDFGLEPFEHSVEPDGSLDMNDIPTALDREVYVLPGPLGMIFGAGNSVATLFSHPYFAPTGDALTALLVDKSGFGYSRTRGRYTRQVSSGRRVALAMDYRRLNTFEFPNSDDTYNYDGDYYSPLGSAMGFRAVGHLYSRKGTIIINPINGGSTIVRHRYDRNARLSWMIQNQPHTVKYEFGYKYRKQQSHLDSRYVGRFDLRGKGLFAAREWVAGKSTTMKLDVEIEKLQYLDGLTTHSRAVSDLSYSLVRSLSDSSRFALNLGQRSADRFGSIPRLNVAHIRESERFFLLASAGYSGREPSQDELFSPHTIGASLYSGSLHYVDEGNPGLKLERQLVASVDVEFGEPDRALALSVATGKLFNAIHWYPRKTGDSLRFTPINRNESFATVTIRKKVCLADVLRFNGGASYHFVGKHQSDTSFYQPDYQLFSGLELHLYWPQRLLHLSGYGEVMYVGPYQGYQKEVGNYAVANLKLSFQMGHFHFYYIFQNLTGVTFEPRDNVVNSGQIRTWGFNWNFLN